MSVSIWSLLTLCPPISSGDRLAVDISADLAEHEGEDARNILTSRVSGFFSRLAPRRRSRRLSRRPTPSCESTYQRCSQVSPLAVELSADLATHQSADLRSDTRVRLEQGAQVFARHDAPPAPCVGGLLSGSTRRGGAPALPKNPSACP